MLIAGLHEADIAFEIDRAVVVAFVEVDGDADGRAGANKRPVFEGFGLAEDPGLLGLVIRIKERAGGLGHRFEHHHAGEDREVREVVLQIFLGTADMLDGYQ